MTSLDNFRAIVDRYLSAKANRSINGLAKRAGVGESTLRRILQGEVEPSFETLLSILGIVATNEEMVAIIRNQFPKIAEYFRAQIERYSPSVSIANSGSEDLPDLFEKYLRKEDSFRILILALTRTGTTRENVKQTYGDRGLALLEQMVSEKVLEEHKDGVIRGIVDVLLMRNYELAMQIESHFSSMFAIENIGKGKAALFQDTETVNSEAIEKIRTVVARCAEEVSQIQNDPNSHGDIPFFFSAKMNVL